RFDHALLELEKQYSILGTPAIERYVLEDRNLLAYQKGDLLFVFNFHPTWDVDVDIWSNQAPSFVLDTDDGQYGGFGPRNHYHYNPDNQTTFFHLVPRSAMVVKL
ncbi:MAG: alpha amylase C-terminal domain-containing protein, partial [Streptococcaceae bacterium]|nr:alpha amylase C-terminal domain-containing protein [Streptococcaceae bacterium]